MNYFKGISSRMAICAGIIAAAAGLSSPVMAGAIFSDFTQDYTGFANGQAGNGASQFITGTAGSLSTAPLTFLLPDSVGADLTVQGFRTADNRNLPIRLARSSVANELHNGSLSSDHSSHGHTDNRGFSLCSDYNGTSTHGCVGGSSGSTAVNSGTAKDESVRFSIADGFMFAVQYFSFGDVGSALYDPDGTGPLLPYANDNARLYFGGNEFNVGGTEEFIEFNIRTAALASVDSNHPELGCFADQATPFTGEDRICTVDIYKVVRDSYLSAAASDDEVFNFLQSDYFRFSAEGINDDWYIRAAQWVVIPEPASLTLLGAGLMGLGYFGKRRRA